MRLSSVALLAVSGAMLMLGGCVTQSDLDPYAKKSDLAALRSELMAEIGKAQDTAQRAEQEAAAASQSAQQAAANAASASEKADAIFRQSLRK